MRQLMCQCLARDYRIGPGFVALVELPGFGAKAHREVGRLDECPAQVWISVPGIAFALLLAVAHALAVHAPRVGGEVASAGEMFDGPGFQHDHGGKRLTNAGHRGQQGVVRVWRDLFLKTLFHDGDLCGERSDDRDVCPLNSMLHRANAPTMEPG